MTGKIRIAYTWNKSTCKRAMEYHYGLPFNPNWRTFFFAGGIISLMLSVGFFLSGFGILVATLYMVIGLYFLVFRRRIHVWQSVRRFDRRPDRDAQVEWHIDAVSIEGRIDEGNRAEITWDRVVRALKTPDGFLVYPLENFFYFFPRSGFTSDADVARFEEILKEKVSLYRSV